MGAITGVERVQPGLPRARSRFLATLARAASVVLVAGLAGSPALGQAQAQAKAAELRSVSGVVVTQRPGSEPKVATANAELAVGDTVGTQKNAFALVVFNDGSRVALRPESALAIRGFSYKPDDPSADQMSVQLLKGWLRNVSGQIGKRGNDKAFELRVNDATIGIRGTDFAVRLCDEACVAGGSGADSEGLLPHSRRLGRVLTASQPVQRQRDGAAGGDLPFAAAGAALFLGDTLTAGESEAILALDDGTRVVLAPRASLALRAEEDARGRRAVRLDLLDGVVRVATPESSGARLYGLLLNAGETIGVRQGSAVDLGCERAARESYSCPAGAVTLRRGQAEVLSDKGVRSMRAGGCERVADSRSGAAAATSCPVRVEGLFDPLDIPVDAARVADPAQRLALGVYTAVFEGQIELSTPSGKLLISAGQGGFAPAGGESPPVLLPVPPRFMEFDTELDRAKIFPLSCVK